MEKFANLLKRKPYLRFFASIQLAIPLLTILICVVATGTILESRYNSDYARLMIYDSTWFFALLVLLCINILLSTLSRYPYKRHQTGFVIVHIGLLTLMFGAFLTKSYGLDGQLRVEESGKTGTVLENDLTLDLIDVQADLALHAPLVRGSSNLTESSLDFLNDKFNSKIIVRQFVPFAEVRESFAEGDGTVGGPVALGFMMKSQFFDVSEWLQSADHPEMKMGPATVRLIVDSASQAKPNKAVQHFAKAKLRGSKTAKLVVRDEGTDKLLGEFLVTDLKPGLKFGKGAVLVAVKTYQHAVVLSNHLAEGNDPGSNPALEMKIKSGNATIREVAYAKFPGFTLHQNKGKSLGLKFVYQVAGGVTEEDETQAAAHEPGSRQGNVIEFHVAPQGGDSVRVELYKNDQQVLSQTVVSGESIVTPWMGIKITVGALKRNANSRTEILPATIQPRSDLPPSAIYLTTAGTSKDQGFWLVEGQFKRVNILGRDYEVYYGRRTRELPFKINLIEFTKTDYPGTETPMSFASRIKVDGGGEDIVVSMNEPLKLKGYTLYQSSYDIRPGQARASIFSVNNDPGRAVKYAGSIILALGIITFTLMRSRVYQNRAAKKRSST